MMKIEIESGLPIPIQMRTRSPIRLALESMKIGDSFSFDLGFRDKVSGSVTSLRNNSAMRFSVRREHDGHQKLDTARVWRVK